MACLLRGWTIPKGLPRRLKELPQYCTAALEYHAIKDPINEKENALTEKDQDLVDKVQIKAKAGNGGSGCNSLWKSSKKGKFRPADGGNGGRGGDVIVQACSMVKDLRGIRFLQAAGNGGHGQSQKQAGTRGKDRIISVAVGTTVSVISPVDISWPDSQACSEVALSESYSNGTQALQIAEGSDQASQHASEDCKWQLPVRANSRTTLKRVLADLTFAGSSVVVARGGMGGRGNVALRSRPGRPASRDKESGKPGEDLLIELELKLLADVGFVGAPNAGKSTLLRAMSSAKPRVGSFAFTTLKPQLGAVLWKDRQLVAADIPGLIAGAAQNKGLGLAFLRHIERTKMLAYVLDMSTCLGAHSGLKPWDQLKMLQRELATYSPGLLEKDAVVVANKMDLLNEEAAETSIASLQASTGLPIILSSAKEHIGIDELIKVLMEAASMPE